MEKHCGVARTQLQWYPVICDNNHYSAVTPAAEESWQGKQEQRRRKPNLSGLLTAAATAAGSAAQGYVNLRTAGILWYVRQQWMHMLKNRQRKPNLWGLLTAAAAIAGSAAQWYSNLRADLWGNCSITLAFQHGSQILAVVSQWIRDWTVMSQKWLTIGCLISLSCRVLSPRPTQIVFSFLWLCHK